MAQPPRLSPLKETDLALPDSGNVTAEQAREAFRRFFSQINPWADQLNKTLSKGLTFSDNFRCEVVNATFSHGVAQTLSLKTLKKTAGLIALGANGHLVAGWTVQMLPAGTVQVTLWFNDVAATAVAVGLLLVEEGQQSASAPPAYTP
jgi:hypothetical protein